MVVNSGWTRGLTPAAACPSRCGALWSGARELRVRMRAEVRVRLPLVRRLAMILPTRRALAFIPRRVSRGSECEAPYARKGGRQGPAQRRWPARRTPPRSSGFRRKSQFTNAGPTACCSTSRPHGGQPRGSGSLLVHAINPACMLDRRSLQLIQAPLPVKSQLSRTSCTNRTASVPSPTALATRFDAPERTSPATNTPGRTVSSSAARGQSDGQRRCPSCFAAPCRKGGSPRRRRRACP